MNAKGKIVIEVAAHPQVKGDWQVRSPELQPYPRRFPARAGSKCLAMQPSNKFCDIRLDRTGENRNGAFGSPGFDRAN